MRLPLFDSLPSAKKAASTFTGLRQALMLHTFSTTFTNKIPQNVFARKGHPTATQNLPHQWGRAWRRSLRASTSCLPSFICTVFTRPVCPKKALMEDSQDKPTCDSAYSACTPSGRAIGEIFAAQSEVNTLGYRCPKLMEFGHH